MQLALIYFIRVTSNINFNDSAKKRHLKTTCPRTEHCQKPNTPTPLNDTVSIVTKEHSYFLIVNKEFFLVSDYTDSQAREEGRQEQIDPVVGVLGIGARGISLAGWCDSSSIQG